MRKIKAGKLGGPNLNWKETVILPIVLKLANTVKLWSVFKMTSLGIVADGILI